MPEIALVPALARAVESASASRWPSCTPGLGTGERQQEWERVRRGEARVVLGPRSALFAPVADLGLIVVDEEQDTSYKQELVPRYHARDLALVRARDAGAAALLVSATPSLESRYNVEQRQAGAAAAHRSAPARATLPEGILVDLRQERGLAPARRGPLLRAAARRDRRRRWRTASRSSCCATAAATRRCCSAAPAARTSAATDCGLPRTYHRRDRPARSATTAASSSRARALCPVCKEEALEPIGAGTERVEESFARAVPRGEGGRARPRHRAPARAAPPPSSSASARGEIQVLIGTQMVSKGHHFPRVALTAVLAADAYLGFPDFRAVERTYNLLTQLAGRAGRGERPGRVVIQTYHPDHYAIQAALRQDDEGFAREEMRFRRVFHYPPYTRMVQLLVRDKNRDRAWKRISELAADLAAHPLRPRRPALRPGPGPAGAAARRMALPAPRPLRRRPKASTGMLQGGPAEEPRRTTW